MLKVPKRAHSGPRESRIYCARVEVSRGHGHAEHRFSDPAHDIQPRWLRASWRHACPGITDAQFIGDHRCGFISAALAGLKKNETEDLVRVDVRAGGRRQRWGGRKV